MLNFFSFLAIVNGMDKSFSLLKAQTLFDLAKFKQAAIFENVEFVWEVLSRLSAFLKTLTLGKIEVDIPLGVTLVHPESVSIGKGTVLESGAYIKGPCWIGENCSIRQGAYIRGDVITGDHCVIGHATEIKNALLLDHVHAAHFAYVGDSLLGNRVNLGAGVKCANLKLDHTPILISYQSEKWNTGLKKFGAIIGDGCQIGCNTVLNPGTVLGKNVDCYPNLTLGGVVEPDQIIKNRDRLCFISKSK